MPRQMSRYASTCLLIGLVAGLFIGFTASQPSPQALAQPPGGLPAAQPPAGLPALEAQVAALQKQVDALQAVVNAIPTNADGKYVKLAADSQTISGSLTTRSPDDSTYTKVWVKNDQFQFRNDLYMYDGELYYYGDEYRYGREYHRGDSHHYGYSYHHSYANFYDGLYSLSVQLGAWFPEPAEWNEGMISYDFASKRLWYSDGTKWRAIAIVP